ncbi:hypothetical protein FRC11_007300 [Ceratobasidium sp. 423]|nr:hypothetical protein FRC11_007300 [Ceratobasidium sp. 423]
MGSNRESQSGSQPLSVDPIETEITWEGHVRLCTQIRPLFDGEYDHCPEARKLRALFEKSTTVPAWLRNLDSPEYLSYRNPRASIKNEAENLHNDIILGLSLSKPGFVLDTEDRDLAADVSQCLPHILHVVYRTKKLQARGATSSIEVDYRQTMDSLGMMVWDTQSEEKLIYLAERTLQLPALSYHARSARPDACTFIVSPEVPRVEPSLFTALTCFPGDTGIPLQCLFLHWVTDFKRAFDKEESIRQVLEGLVSGLYQRRALGFTDHFVFGTAHHTRGLLDVFAATWVPSNNLKEGAGSPQQPHSQNDVPSDGQGDHPLLDLPAGGAPLGTETEVEDRSTMTDEVEIEDIMKRDQIVVYRVKQYSMLQTIDILRLYLFMRQTRFLALKYEEVIHEHSTERITKLSQKASDSYRWPPPPRKPRSRQRSATNSTGSNQRKRLKTVREEQDLALDQSSSSDLGSDSDEPTSLSDASQTCVEPTPLSGASQTRVVMGEVADYTLKDHAYNGHGSDCRRLHNMQQAA